MDDGGSFMRFKVDTTRSPRVFPINSQISSFGKLLDKKLPSLKEKIKPENEAELYHMVTALEQKKDIFEKAFIEVKQASEKEMTDEPNPQLVAFQERLDIIYVRDIDKLIENLTRSLPMDLDAFFQYFQGNFSLPKTQFTITLAQFIEIYIEYIETTHYLKLEGS